MVLMLASQSMEFFRSGDLIEVIGPFVVLAVIIFFALLWYARQGRNSALEILVMQAEFGPPESFRGTLTVQEHKPGHYLRLSKSTSASRRLQFWNRWVIGTGRQAVFDEVTIDGSRGSVELKRKNKDTTALFSEFSAIRMREVAGGRDLSALWHIELIPQEGKPLPFVTSERGDRRAMFEQTAPVAKAVSAIMAIPVHVFVAGNIWTPGWPPKNHVASS
jgi:hypothetical protein